MRARAAFTLSLLAALGVHAVILLVPRAAFVGEAKALPTILIDLSQTPAVMAITAGAGSAPSRARAAPPPPVLQEPVAAPAAPVEAPARNENIPTEPPEAAPPAPEPAPGPGAAALPPAGSTAGAAAASGGTGAAVEGNDSTAARGGTEGGNAVRVSAPALATDLSTPVPLTPILPVYPRGARRAGTQGVVKVGAMVSESGAVTAVEVVLSSGSGLLDHAAVEAVRQAAFVPARQNGRAIACRILIPIRFQLAKP